MLHRVAAFFRPLRPVLLLVSFPRSRSPVVGVPGLCWMRWDVPFACQRRPIIGVLQTPPSLRVGSRDGGPEGAMSKRYRALAHTPVTQAYGHSHDSQYIVLTCCTAAQTRSVLNVALGGGSGDLNVYTGGGGGIPCGGNMNLQILARQNLCHLLKNARTNCVRFPIIAHEKQWALLLPAQIHTNTEKSAQKNFVQNLKCRNSTLHNPPPPQYLKMIAPKC